MKDTTGQRGRTIELMIPIALIALIAAVVLPNYMQARDRNFRQQCTGSLITLGKLMEMYAGDSKETTYPVQLNGHTGIVDKKIVNALGKYFNITGTLKGCGAIFLKVTKSKYTMTAKAKDRAYTLITKTSGAPWPE